MARRSIECRHCGAHNAKCSRLTGIYWCKNCNMRLPLKREFEVKVEREIIKGKKIESPSMEYVYWV